MNNIKEMVKNKTVRFLYFKDRELFYITECGFKFPVSIDDVGTASMNAEDKAIFFMRWIRKEIVIQEELNKMKQESSKGIEKFTLPDTEVKSLIWPVVE